MRSNRRRRSAPRRWMGTRFEGHQQSAQLLSILLGRSALLEEGPPSGSSRAHSVVCSKAGAATVTPSEAGQPLDRSRHGAATKFANLQREDDLNIRPPLVGAATPTIIEPYFARPAGGSRLP